MARILPMITRQHTHDIELRVYLALSDVYNADPATPS